MIGRTAGQLLFPHDPALSHEHCRITPTPNGLSIFDFGSENGTFVGPSRIPAREEVLLSGAAVDLRAGSQVFRLNPPAQLSVMTAGGPAVTGAAAQDFRIIQEQSEEILWAAKPHFLPYVVRGFVLFAMLLALIALQRDEVRGKQVDHFSQRESNILALFFCAIVGVPGLLLTALSYRNTSYAITNKRVIFRGGVFGPEFDSIDFDRITDIQISVGPLERLLGLGTIYVYSGQVSSRGVSLSDRFIGIENAYEVYKRLKEVSVDVKTDWYYPNALRPSSNPGYRTKYK